VKDSWAGRKAVHQSINHFMEMVFICLGNKFGLPESRKCHLFGINKFYRASCA
jgi:hypothetical protein